MIRRATGFPVTILLLFLLTISLQLIGGEYVGVSQQNKNGHERIQANNDFAIKVDQDIAKLRDDEEEKAGETDYCTENPSEPECNSKSPSDEDETTT